MKEELALYLVLGLLALNPARAVAEEVVKQNVNYSSFKFPKEIEKIKLHAKRREIEPELLMAVRMAEQGKTHPYGIIPTGPQEERYNLDNGYEYEGKFYEYESELEKNMCWSAITLAKRCAEYNALSESKKKNYIDVIDYIGEKYATRGFEVWEEKVRKYNQKFKGGKN